MSKPLVFFTFREKTVFTPLSSVFPECKVLIEGHPKAHPLQCFNTDCPVNRSCAETIAKRVHFWFDKVLPDNVQLMFAYFKHMDRPDSVRAAVFWRDHRDPKVIVTNRSFYQKCRKEGLVYSWTPDTSYWNIGTSNQIIPVENLIRGNRES